MAVERPLVLLRHNPPPVQGYPPIANDSFGWNQFDLKLSPAVKRLLIFLALAILSLPAHARTGDFLPQLVSIFIGVPVLLLLPALAIALATPGPARKLPWVAGALWWAVQAWHLMASVWWPLIYFPVLPGFVLLIAFRRANR